MIEVDTDGLYFVPPRPAAATSEDALLAELADILPAGIQLELDGRYPAMFSYKMKNYVLLDPRGKLLVKGSGLRSRGIELFQRKWMEEMFRLSLTGRREEIPALVARWEDDFRAHRVPVRDFMKTETLQESLAAYQDKLKAGQRNPAAAYELALAVGPPVSAGRPGVLLRDGRRALSIKVNEAAKLAAAWDRAKRRTRTSPYYVEQAARALRRSSARSSSATGSCRSADPSPSPPARRREWSATAREVRAAAKGGTSRRSSAVEALSWLSSLYATDQRELRGRAGASSRTRASRLRAVKPASRASLSTAARRRRAPPAAPSRSGK